MYHKLCTPLEKEIVSRIEDITGKKIDCIVSLSTISAGGLEFPGISMGLKVWGDFSMGLLSNNKEK